METRRTFLGWLGATALSAQSQRQKPNFLILLTDDQRFDTLRAVYGGPWRTPNLDRLSREGVVFTNACTQGGLTGAICMPSRAQLLTGQSVFRAHRGIVDRQADPDPAMITFPELLGQRGYRTFATGKWHNGPKLFNRSFQEGTDLFFGGMSDQVKTLVRDYDPSGKYPAEAGRITNRFSSEVFSDAAIRFLKGRNQEKPFLAYVAYTSPHDPRMAPQRFADLFPPDKIELPPNFLPQHPFDNGELKVRDEMLAAFPRTPAEIRRHIAGYLAMVAEVDHQIGRVLDALEASGEAGNTYVIFAGDNGLAVGQHGLMGKQNLYEHSIRVPLVVRGPGLPRGQRAATLCHLMDVAPTVAGLAGAELAGAIDGRSLQPVLAEPGRKVRESVVAAYRGFQRAIRTEEYKLIRYRVGGAGTDQLFDVVRDPFETRNLANDRKHAALVATLRRSLHRQLAEAGDPEADQWA
ncbi:MAG TPA: sulfatase [Solibacterales bacterium]|nr:sulfatase [Bryobacterales bacterium]